MDLTSQPFLGRLGDMIGDALGDRLSREGAGSPDSNALDRATLEVNDVLIDLNLLAGPAFGRSAVELRDRVGVGLV